MAKTAFKQPNILTIEFRQERGDPDYGSCLWANFNFDLERYELTIMILGAGLLNPNFTRPAV